MSNDDSELRGIHAKHHIPPHTVCMSIPRRCLITVEMGQATPIGREILNADLDLDAPKHIFLMIYILWDRKVNGHKSFFHPYYEILPKTLRNMPIFWTTQELGYLEGSYLLHQIDDRNQAIADDYNAICQVAPLAELCTLDEFKWARMCVCSRNFGLQIDGQRTSAMVPHADMLNHYRPRETKWTFDESTQSFTITSLQHIPAGAQVYDSYGQKCNHRFLLNYGFAVEDNRELDGFCPNEVSIELYVDPEDDLFPSKLEFWTRGEVPPMDRFEATPVVKRVRVCVSNNENTRLLFSLLRALACNEDELETIAQPMADISSSRHHLFGLPEVRAVYRSCRDIRHPICLRNERVAMQLLLDVLRRHLSRYPTTLQQDMADLSNELEFPRFSNKRHAKIQVKGEKEVLHHFADWARTALELLDLLEDEMRDERGSVEVQMTGRASVFVEERPSFENMIRRMEEDEAVHHTILRYCADVLGSLRREEMKKMRRQHQHAPSGYL